MKKWNYKTPGIPDDLFVRGNVPMTKEEVRAVIMARLRLKSGHLVYDIGAGTGSLSIEAALQAGEGKVYAVERDRIAQQLIIENVKKFGLNNIIIIAGQAPQVLEPLPVPDRVIIGGSGGHLREILNLVDRKMKKGGRIVITAVTVNTLNLAVTHLENLHYCPDICNIAVTRTSKVANYHMLKALNPVYLISAEKGETNDDR